MTDLADLENKEFLKRFENFIVGLPLQSPYCQFSCSHCYVGEISNKKSTPEESKKRHSKLGEILNVSKILGKKNLEIVGTEPTLEPDLVRIVDTFMNWGNMVTMSTNGWYTGSEGPFKIPAGEYDSGSALLDDLILDFRTLGIMVSIDGIGEVHDTFRNHPGSYERAIRTLDFAKQQVYPLATGVEVVIHPKNQHQLKDLVDVLVEHEVQLIKMVPVLGVGYGANIRPFNEEERANIQATLADLVPQLFASGVKPKFNNWHLNFPSYSLTDLTYCPDALAPRFFQLRNIPFDISQCAYPEMPGIGNLLERPLVEIMLDIPNSWAYRLHSEIKEKGIEEVGRIVTDPQLRHKQFNYMCGPCLIMTNVYKLYHETGNIEQANQMVRKMFVG
jgi:MoaA/NifB/PqqE/SkfB family radical SAM enzyme